MEYINESVPEKYNPKIKQILKKMLCADASNRISMEELMKKKFIRQWIHKLKIEFYKNFDDNDKKTEVKKAKRRIKI